MFKGVLHEKITTLQHSQHYTTNDDDEKNK